MTNPTPEALADELVPLATENARLTERVAALEGALRDVANAVPLGPLDSVLTWHRMVEAMRHTALRAWAGGEGNAG